MKLGRKEKKWSEIIVERMEQNANIGYDPKLME